MGNFFSGEYQRPAVDSKVFPALFERMPSMSGKTVAITGCTSGTGQCLATKLAEKGARIIMLNRPSERAAAALAKIREIAGDDNLVDHIDCDLMDFDSVRAAADKLLEKNEPIGACHCLRFEWLFNDVSSDLGPFCALH